MAPLENEHPELLGEDYQRYIADEDHYQVPEYREVVDEIQRRTIARELI